MPCSAIEAAANLIEKYGKERWFVHVYIEANGWNVYSFREEVLVVCTTSVKQAKHTIDLSYPYTDQSIAVYQGYEVILMKTSRGGKHGKN